METLQKVLHPKSLLQGERVCVVTGADKGIGFAVVKGLLRENPNWIVYLTARDIILGEAAVKRCYDEITLTPKFFQLDIDDISSIRRFRDHLRENHKNGIHILVNNAGISPDVRAEGFEQLTGFGTSATFGTTRVEKPGVVGERGGRVEAEVMEAGRETGGAEPLDRQRGVEFAETKRSEEQLLQLQRDVGEVRKEEVKLEEGRERREEEGKQKEEVKFKYNRENCAAIIKNNYFSTLHVCEELFPLLGDNSSVIFVGSRMANLAFMSTKEDKQLQLRGCVRIEDCSKLMESLMNADPDKLYNAEDKTDEAAWLSKSPDTELIPNYKLGAIYPWAMSKLGLAIICHIYQRQFDAEKMSQNVHLVTCCPGLVKTELNPLGVRTPEQGADTIVWSALLPKDSQIRGVVCGDRKMLDSFVLPEGEAIF